MNTARPPLHRARAFVSIESGIWHSCGILVDQTAVCWGLDENRQTSPPPHRFSSISIGFDKTCGVRTEGAIACWGARYSDFPTSPPEGQFDSVAVGGSHACAIRSNGSAVCWGRNDSGQASPPGGELLPDSRPEPVRTATLPEIPAAPAEKVFENFAAMSSGYRHTCALRAADGGAECWGDDRYGQSSPPADVRFESVSGGAMHTCALRRRRRASVLGRVGLRSRPDLSTERSERSPPSAAAAPTPAPSAQMVLPFAGATVNTASSTSRQANDSPT